MGHVQQFNSGGHDNLLVLAGDPTLGNEAAPSLALRHARAPRVLMNCLVLCLCCICSCGWLTHPELRILRLLVIPLSGRGLLLALALRSPSSDTLHFMLWRFML